MSPLVSIGEKNSGTKQTCGNRKFKLSDDLKKVYLKLKDRTVEIFLPRHIHKNYSDVLKKLLMHQKLGDMPITYKLDSEYIYISYSLQDLNSHIEKEHILFQDVVMSVDANPNYIGWSVVRWKSHSDFTLIDSGVISFKSLNDYEKSLKRMKLYSSDSRRIYVTNERRHEIHIASQRLANIALHY